jgi:hypothetical protein
MGQKQRFKIWSICQVGNLKHQIQSDYGVIRPDEDSEDC